MMINKLINKTELSKLLGAKSKTITNKRLPQKHQDKIKELEDLINYWKTRHNLNE